MHSKLFVLRKEKGVTQKEMASLIGLSSDGYKNKERGKTEFKLSEAFTIAKFFELPVEEIFLR